MEIQWTAEMGYPIQLYDSIQGNSIFLCGEREVVEIHFRDRIQESEVVNWVQKIPHSREEQREYGEFIDPPESKTHPREHTPRCVIQVIHKEMRVVKSKNEKWPPCPG